MNECNHNPLWIAVDEDGSETCLGCENEELKSVIEKYRQIAEAIGAKGRSTVIRDLQIRAEAAEAGVKELEESSKMALTELNKIKDSMYEIDGPDGDRLDTTGNGYLAGIEEAICVLTCGANCKCGRGTTQNEASGA